MKSDSDPSRTTWYEATANRGLPRPGLSGAVEAEICVIGGGLAGLTTALELARRGRSVALLEGHRLAGAASGRNGGFVSNGFAEGMDKVAGRVGLDAAQALYRLSQFGTEFVRREIAESDPTIRMGDGWLGAIRYDNAAEKQAGIAAMARDYGQETAIPRCGRRSQAARHGSVLPGLLRPFRLSHASPPLCPDDRGEERGSRRGDLREYPGPVGGEGVLRLDGLHARWHAALPRRGLLRVGPRSRHPSSHRPRRSSGRHLCRRHRAARPGCDPDPQCHFGFPPGRQLLPPRRRRAPPVGRRHHHARVGAVAAGFPHAARHGFGLSAARQSAHRLRLERHHGLCAPLHAADRHRRRMGSGGPPRSAATA